MAITPGNWTVHGPDARGEYTIRKENGMTESTVIARGVLLHNAHTISMVPEMLETLKEIAERDDGAGWLANETLGWLKRKESFKSVNHQA